MHYCSIVVRLNVHIVVGQKNLIIICPWTCITQSLMSYTRGALPYTRAGAEPIHTLHEVLPIHTPHEVFLLNEIQSCTSFIICIWTCINQTLKWVHERCFALYTFRGYRYTRFFFYSTKYRLVWYLILKSPKLTKILHTVHHTTACSGTFRS